jgi:hypothetical protein
MTTRAEAFPELNQTKKKLSSEQQKELFRILRNRFEKNMDRHKNLDWEKVQARLETNPAKLSSLNEMENTGGEPDVIGYDTKSDKYLFCDCSVESPKGRRNVCYDEKGRMEREKHGLHPAGSAIGIAVDMGIEILSEEEYIELQQLGSFDTKTQSWVKTPVEIRKQGGGLFADRRYDRVFIYHNGAPSFYAGRGFRGLLKV